MASRDSIKRSVLLEKRIARLEKLIKNESGIVFDGMGRILRDLETVFYDHFGNEDNYDSEREFEENMFAACEGANDMMVDDAIMYLANDYGYDEESLEDLRDDIADYIADCADKVYKQEDWEDDWDEDDEDFESLKRNMRQTSRNESTKRSQRSRFHK
jgi:hypothetical protein